MPKGRNMYLLNKLRFILANDQILLNKQQELVRSYHHDKISFLKALVSNSFKIMRRIWCSERRMRKLGISGEFFGHFQNRLITMNWEVEGSFHMINSNSGLNLLFPVG